jgi:prophage regulatory protein
MAEPGVARILRLPEVMHRTGLSRATLYRRIASGDFPPGRKLSINCVGCLEADIDNWIAGLSAVSGQG